MISRRISYIKRFLVKRMEKILFSGKVSDTDNGILLLKLDKLGDYILFRNFIEELNRFYKGSRRIVFCGNIVLKDFAEKLDSEFIKEFIWVDVPRLDEYRYRFWVYKKMRKAGCGTLIHGTYSRTMQADKLVQYSGARELIGYCGDETNMPKGSKAEYDLIYTKLVQSEARCMFEFYRNKFFFEDILNATINIDSPYIKTSSLVQGEKHEYIVIFPGAGHESRRWDTSNFRKLSKLLFDFYKLPIFICGAKNEMKLGEEIAAKQEYFITNSIGKYNLFETTDMVKKAKFIISGDTGPFHLALALRIPTVCISNGNHFERFCPYPEAMKMPLLTIYPAQFEEIIQDEKMIASVRCKEATYNINTISPERVFSAIANSNLF